jgi:hypothetical protein
MEKIYLLLRKNQQTGPYTYEELLQQQLVPTDLIWVEGKSAVWLIPSELNTFIATHTNTKKTNPDAVNHGGQTVAPHRPSGEIPWYQKKRSPEDELEERALAVRERAQAAADHSYYPVTPATHTRRRKHMVYQEEDSPVLLEVHTLHKKNVSLPQLIAAGVITALVVTGWYNREALNIVRSQQTEVSQAAAPVTFQVTLPTPSPKPTLSVVVDTLADKAQDTAYPTSIAASSVPVQQIKPVKTEVKQNITQEPVAAPALVKSTPAEKKEEIVVDTAAATAKMEKKETVDTTMEQAENNTTAEQVTERKKKGLGQAIKKIFKKKKKDNEPDEAEKVQ